MTTSNPNSENKQIVKIGTHNVEFDWADRTWKVLDSKSECCRKCISNCGDEHKGMEECLKPLCECHQSPAAEESWEEFDSEYVNLDEKLLGIVVAALHHGMTKGVTTSASHITEKLRSIVHSELSLTRKDWNRKLVEELEGMKKEYPPMPFEAIGVHPIDGYNAALDEIIANRTEK